MLWWGRVSERFEKVVVVIVGRVEVLREVGFDDWSKGGEYLGEGGG